MVYFLTTGLGLLVLTSLKGSRGASGFSGKVKGTGVP